MTRAKPVKTPQTRTNPPALAEIQDRFQAALLAGDDDIFARVLDNSRTSRQTLMGVYQHAYMSRLVDIVRNEYPALESWCGTGHFDELATAYITAVPSRSPNARWVGRHLPEFLRGHASAESVPELAEIADIERALADAFDAPDAPVLGLAALRAFPAEEWGRLIFSPHPSARRIDAKHNSFAIWQALSGDATPPEAQRLPDRETLVVWRSGSAPRVRVMTAEEAMIWTEAGRGRRFDALCEMLAAFDDPAGAAGRAAGYLQGWLNAGMLTAARLAAIAKRRPRTAPRSLDA